MSAKSPLLRARAEEADDADEAILPAEAATIYVRWVEWRECLKR